jgi:hypothetical protein
VDGQTVDAPLYDPQARTATLETGLFRTLEVALE